MCANFFQAIGMVKQSSFLNLLRQCLLLIPLILILSFAFGLYGVFVAVPIADLVAFIITMYLIKKEMKTFAKENGYPDVDTLVELNGEDMVKEAILQNKIMEWVADNCKQVEKKSDDKKEENTDTQDTKENEEKTTE